MTVKIQYIFIFAGFRRCAFELLGADKTKDIYVKEKWLLMFTKQVFLAEDKDC